MNENKYLLFYIPTRWCAVVTICSLLVNAYGPPHVRRHQFMMFCTETM